MRMRRPREESAMDRKEGADGYIRQEHSLRRLSADTLQGFALSTQLFWIGLWSVVRAVGGAVVWLVWVVEQVRRVRLLHAREKLSVSYTLISSGLWHTHF
jgi:hypothetical protein